MLLNARGYVAVLMLSCACRLWLLHEGRVQLVSSLGDGLSTLEAPAVLGEGALLQLEDKSFA